MVQDTAPPDLELNYASSREGKGYGWRYLEQVIIDFIVFSYLP